jgi:predicted ATPase/DNA-binding SARP family transcriptional activator
VLTVAVLGALEVKRDGERVLVPAGKTTELAIRLALEAGELVRADRLVEDLWAARGATTQRNTLQSKVAMLRRALGDPGAIESHAGGYALAVVPANVDALAALDLAATASRLLDDGDDGGAADVATSALQLFRGEALQNAGDGAWVSPHRARLEETRMNLLEIQFAARLRLGDVDAIGELEATVATYPFQEGMWELLITALYRAGRQADALETYQRVRNRLADELGLDPRPQLQELERRILAQDSSLDLPDRRVARRTDALRSSGNLPSMAVELVGREGEVTALAELLVHERLVEIVGTGGIGKTAVAICTGRRLTTSTEIGAGGIWLARLETAVTENDVVDAVVSAVGGPGGEAALIERLRRAPALVILDNCEHVVDAAADLAVRLLDAAPGLRILCTSQVALDIDGEAVFDLEPLALSDAVELFTRRASGRRMHQTTTPAEDDDAMVDLCRSLDGLPLAIELAAARTRTLSVQEITRRLDDRFLVLSDPTSRRPERRRSLGSTIRWSYDLLFPDDQRGLLALAVFSGGASLPAVEFVLGALDVPAVAAIDVLGRLASRSLLIVDDDSMSPDAARAGQPGGHAVRYRLLDSIRAFAMEAMTDVGLPERAREAHAVWFAMAADASTEGVRGPSQAEHLAFARTERANIDAALAWSRTHDPLLALSIVNGFGWSWVVLGDSRGAERILAALDAAGDDASAHDRANALLLAAWIEASTDHLASARNHITAATDLADANQDAELQARCCYYLAYVVSHDGDFAQATELTDRSRAIYDQLDRPWDQAANWLFAARAALSAGDERRSVEAADQVQRWLRNVDDPWLRVRGEAMLGELARLQHRFDDAVLHIGGAAETSRQLGFQQTEAYQVTSLGRAQCQAGAYDAGASTLALAVDKALATGDVRLAALARVHLGRVLRAVGDVEGARSALEAASAWHREAGGGELAALGDCLLAAMDAAEGVAGSRRRLEQILEAASHRGDAPVEVFALDAIARLAAEDGDSSRAGELCEAADRRMEAASHFITELDRCDARWVRAAGG